MNGITVTMAIVDFIPVVLFFIATILLQRDLYSKMTKGCYALLASGSYMVLISGIYKATWKILYALNICDFVALDTSMFPMQAPGFILVFLSLVGMNTQLNKNSLKSVVVVPFTSNLPFIIGQVVGCAGTQFCLMMKSLQMKKKSAAICYVLAFIFMLGMGYLGAKFDDTSNMHWIAQVTNIISQGSFLLGTWILHKNGLKD